MTGHKVYAWVCIILGALAVLSGLGGDSTDAVVGGAMFVAAGVVINDAVKKTGLK